MKKALITGITGQDGSYLAELLLEKGYEVHGIIRRSSTFSTVRIDHIYQDAHSEPRIKLFLHYGDLADAENIRKLIYKIQPDEIYNLGAQSHVRVSFDIPEYTANITGVGVLRVLEAIRDFQEHTGKIIKLYQASSSEMFGATPPPLYEDSPFRPRSPYGCAKVFAYHASRNYRDAYNLFICNGILFNHESPRRGETFVTRKITRGLARIKLGKEQKIYLGNLDAKRDWGYAKDYVEGMWLMLQHTEPDDFILATNETHSVREFAEAVAGHLGTALIWKGKGIKEQGFDKKTGRVVIEIDSRYFRPAEVDVLFGDYSKAKKKLGWRPKVTFHELAQMMAEADLKLEKRQK